MRRHLFNPRVPRPAIESLGLKCVERSRRTKPAHQFNIAEDISSDRMYAEEGSKTSLLLKYDQRAWRRLDLTAKNFSHVFNGRALIDQRKRNLFPERSLDSSD